MGQDQSLPPLSPDETTISYTNNDLISLPVFIPDDHVLESADVCGNRLTQFPLFLPHLRFLDASSNSLFDYDFSPHTFSFESLEILRLSRNMLHTLPAIVNGFQKLTEFVLDYNQLESEEIDFSVFPALQHLDLFLNLFKAFPKLPDSLVSLNIGFNHIRSISLHLPNLTELRLAGNELTEIGNECKFPKLRTLDLAMNRLVQIHPISSFAPKLVSLNCSHNFLSHFPSEFPSSLVRLDLSHNILEDVNDELAELSTLESLDISWNHLRQLPRLPISLLHFSAEMNLLSEAMPLSMTRLNTLQLSSNQFTTIPEFHCSCAAILLMRFNKLTEIHTERISPATKRIDLTKNDITDIPIQCYSLTGLQSLNLSVNRIQLIRPEIISLRITSLSLSENPISDLPALPITLMSLNCIGCTFRRLPESLFNLPRLGSIDFSCNLITDLPRLPNCQTILLSLNLIRRLPVLPPSLFKLDISCNLLTEIVLEGDFVGVQDLDVSHNQIRRFIASSLPVLSVLKLTGNPLSMSLNFSVFPALSVLDIARTKCKLISPLPHHLKEVSLSEKDAFTKLNTPIVRFYRYDKVVGYSETIGVRRSMEDALIIWRSFVPGLNMYAVIDGHGGVETAAQSAYLIPKFFRDVPIRAIAEMSAVFRRVNIELQKLNVRDGATIVLALVGPTEIGVSHLGDSRAVVIKRNLAAVSLTVDHKATERSEIDLVKENRSFVDGNRIAGSLAVSRAMGDFAIPGVGRVPSLTQHKRVPDDFRLILACDGLFDVIDNADIGKIIANEPNVHRAAYLLRNIALARGSQDNISVIVVDLTKYSRK